MMSRRRKSQSPVSAISSAVSSISRGSRSLDSPSLLIDGQQRLTTLTLILRDADQEARQNIVDHGSPRDGDTGSVARRYRALLEATLSREPEKILRRLDHTCHVNVVLGPQDNNQDIFESLLTPSQESSFQAWW